MRIGGIKFPGKYNRKYWKTGIYIELG